MMTNATIRSAAGEVNTPWRLGCGEGPTVIRLAAAVAALLLAAPLAAGAQQAAKVPRIGILDYSPVWEPFRQALRDLGHVEGLNIAIE